MRKKPIRTVTTTTTTHSKYVVYRLWKFMRLQHLVDFDVVNVYCLSQLIHTNTHLARSIVIAPQTTTTCVNTTHSRSTREKRREIIILLSHFELRQSFLSQITAFKPTSLCWINRNSFGTWHR